MSKKFYSFLVGGALTALAAFAATEVVGSGIVGNQDGKPTDFKPAFTSTPKAMATDQNVDITFTISDVVYGSKAATPDTWEPVENPGDVLNDGVSVVLTENGTTLKTTTVNFGEKGKFTLTDVKAGTHTYTLTAKVNNVKYTGEEVATTNEVTVAAAPVAFPTSLQIKSKNSNLGQTNFGELKGSNGVLTGKIYIRGGFSGDWAMTSNPNNLKFYFAEDANTFYGPTAEVCSVTTQQLGQVLDCGLVRTTYPTVYSSPTYWQFDTEMAMKEMPVVVDFNNGTVKFGDASTQPEYQLPEKLYFVNAFGYGATPFVTLNQTSQEGVYEAKNVEFTGNRTFVINEESGNATDYAKIFMPAENVTFKGTVYSGTYGKYNSNNTYWNVPAGKYDFTVNHNEGVYTINITRLDVVVTPDVPNPASINLVNANTNQTIVTLKKENDGVYTGTLNASEMTRFYFSYTNGGFMPAADTSISGNTFTGEMVALDMNNLNSWRVSEGEYDITIALSADSYQITVKKFVNTLPMPSDLVLFHPTSVSIVYGTFEKKGDVFTLTTTITTETEGGKVSFVFGPSPANPTTAYGTEDGGSRGYYIINSDNYTGKFVQFIKNGVPKNNWMIGAGTYTFTVDWPKGTLTVEKVGETIVEPSSITLNPTALTLEVGKTGVLNATVLPANANDKSVTWTTSNASVATVANGVVTAVAPGTAVITAATVNGKTATSQITVKEPVVDVTGITLNKTALDLFVGESETLVATIAPENATDKTITWLSYNEAVATVENGVVKAIAPGTAHITATTANGKSAYCDVTVSKLPVEVVSVELDQTSLELVEGAKATLVATVNPADADDTTVTWTSSDEAVATVADGVVTAVAPGVAVITATTVNGKTATCQVTVTKKAIAVESIELNKAEIELTEGETETLVATVLPANADDTTVTWISSDEAVATVADGVVTAVAEGTATITATAGDKSATCVVKVSKKVIAVESIELNKAEIELTEGETETLVATVLPANADDTTVTWTTSDEAVATVVDGVVTAVAEGEAIITATAGDKTATCKVTVKKAIVYEAVSAEDIEVAEISKHIMKVSWTLLNNADVEGYNIYLKDMDAEELTRSIEGLTLLNTEGVVTTSPFEFEIKGNGSYAVYIETVYTDGETRMSEPKYFNYTGINGLFVDGDAVYFDINGNKVVNPENGLYIRVENGKAQKVMIRK